MRPRLAGAMTTCVSAALLGAFVVSPALAAPHLQFSGFGTVAAGTVDTENLEIMKYDDTVNFDSDSVFAVQADLSTDTGLSATAQLVARGITYSDDEERYDPAFDWGFVAYQWGNKARFRIGRIRTTSYLYAETLEVGYTYPWVRPPIQNYVTYSQASQNFDGADATFYQMSDLGVVEYRVGFGDADSVYRDYEITTTARSFTVTLTQEEDRWKYSFYRVYTTADNPQLDFVVNYFASKATVDPIFNAMGETLLQDDLPHDYHALGWEHDNGDWLITAEAHYTPLPKEQLAIEAIGGYVSVARQLDPWMPYVVIGYHDSHLDPEIIGRFEQSYAAIPAGSDVLLDILRNSIVANLESINIKETTLTAGIRYDVSDSLCVKLENQYFRFHADTVGQFTHSAPAADKPTSANLTTLAVDFTF